MKELVLIIRPEQLETLKQIMEEAGVTGMTMSTVMGCGSQKGIAEGMAVVKGTNAVINLLPKIRVEAVMRSAQVEPVVEKVREKLSTGRAGDGKIFIRTIDEVIRIRTGERGHKAL
jgi:nitrogen regulatory protein P-II 1